MKKINLYMKKIFQLSLLLATTLTFICCEKEDICTQEDPTTAGVVVEFFNDTTRVETNKIPTNLVAVVNGNTTGILTNGAKIELPLPVNNTNFEWNLILNGADEDPTNDVTDVLNFTYSVEQEYISRACGYKANFILDENVPLQATNNWIRRIEIKNPNILNPNETHVKVYF